MLCPPTGVSRAMARRQKSLCKSLWLPIKSVRCLQIKTHLFQLLGPGIISALYMYWDRHSQVQDWRHHWVLLYHKEWQLHLPSALCPYKLLVCRSSSFFSPPANYKWEWEGCKGMLTATQEEIWELLSCPWWFLAVHRAACSSFLLLFRGYSFFSPVIFSNTHLKIKEVKSEN